MLIYLLESYDFFIIFKLVFFFFFRDFIQSWGIFHPQLTLRQVIQPNLEFQSQLGPSIQSGSSPCTGLRLVTQSTHLSKDCYPQLASNPHRSEIQPPKQLDYRCMLLHHDTTRNFKQLLLFYDCYLQTRNFIYCTYMSPKIMPLAHLLNFFFYQMIYTIQKQR